MKRHKSQLASDRTSCRAPLANQTRLILRTAAAVVCGIDQFEVMMIAMLIVSPLVSFLRKPPPVN